MNATPDCATKQLIVPDVYPDASMLDGAFAYAKAGWYVLPIKAGTKIPALGKQWQLQTSRDPHVLVEWFAGTSNMVGLHAGRSGALIIDVDHPEVLPEPLERAMAELRPPRQLTRRNDDRGHLIFHAPPGRTLGNSRGKLLHPEAGARWGEVRGANGYIVVAPSIHPDGAGYYRWQTTGRVPVLPNYIADLLPDQGPTAEVVDDSAVQLFLDSHTRSTRGSMLDKVLRRMHDDAVSSSRHEALVHALPWAMREAQCGFYPARRAATELWKIFADLMGTDRHPRSEFAGVLAWAVAQALSDDPRQRVAAIDARRAERDAQRDVARHAAPAPPTVRSVTV